MPSRYGALVQNKLDTTISSNPNGSVKGMKWIPAGTFLMGAANQEGRADVYPSHQVKLEGYWMDEREVTNAQFAEFVKATGYKTVAERKPDWEEITLSKLKFNRAWNWLLNTQKSLFSCLYSIYQITLLRG